MPLTPATTSLTARLLIAAVSVALVLVSGCTRPRVPTLAEMSPANLPFIHKIDVQQGNVVTQEMLAQLQRGMDKKKVNFIMGSPIIHDTFNADRWDYIFTLQPGGGDMERRLITLHFDEGKLESISGNVTPAATETIAVSRQDTTVDVPLFVPKSFLTRVKEKIPFTGGDEEDNKASSEEDSDAADSKTETTTTAEAETSDDDKPDAADDSDKKSDEEVVAKTDIEANQPPPFDPYENIQIGPGEGIVVPENAPRQEKKKGFFKRIVDSIGIGAEDEQPEDEEDYDPGDPKYRDITDQSNI